MNVYYITNGDGYSSFLLARNKKKALEVVTHFLNRYYSGLDSVKFRTEIKTSGRDYFCEIIAETNDLEVDVEFYHLYDFGKMKENFVYPQFGEDLIVMDSELEKHPLGYFLTTQE